MTGLSLRRYRPEDHDRVQQLHDEPMRAIGEFIDSVPDDDVADIEASYLDAGGEFLVGEYDGKLVAMGGFRPADGYLAAAIDCDPETAGEIKRRRVDEASQGRGFGQQVYDALEQRAREMGFTELVLDTSSKQPVAQQLYEKNGFAVVETIPLVYKDDQFEVAFYRKSLVGKTDNP